MRLSKVVSSFLMVAALAVAVPASAQQPTGSAASDKIVGLGITFLDGNFGVAGDILIKELKPMDQGSLGLVGDVGLNFYDGGRFFSVMGGVRYTHNANGRIRPFGQFLLGIHSFSFDDEFDVCDIAGVDCGNTDFGASVGGGMDIGWNDTTNFRVALDFLMSDGAGARLFLGISKAFGG